MLGLVLALTLAQQWGEQTRFRPDRAWQRAWDRNIYAAYLNRATPALFEFLPASSAGVPTAQPLCATLVNDDKTNPWWCIDAEGTNTGALPDGGALSFTIVDAGSPFVYQTSRLCPNGPDCTAVPEWVWPSLNTSAATGKSGWATPSMQAARGALTVCGLCAIKPDPDGTYGYQNLVSQASGGGSIDFLWQATPASVTTLAYVGTSVGYTFSTTDITDGAYHLICTTASAPRGANSGRPYIDGVQVSSPFNTSPSGSSFGDQPWRISGYSSGAYPMSASTRCRGFFMTSEDLSGARIAAIARAVLADRFYDSTSTYTLNSQRSTSRFCASSDTTGSVLPPNRPCIANGVLEVDSTQTDRISRNEDFANAYWQKIGGGGGSAVTLTARYAKGPAGTWEAARLQTSACSSVGAYSVIASTSFSVPGTYSAGWWVKGNGTSGSISLCVYDTADSGNCTQCAYTSTDWVRCRLDNQSITGNGDVSLGCENRTALFSGATDTGAADVLIAQADLLTGPALTSHIKTISAAVTRDTELMGFTRSIAAPNGVCVAADVSFAALGFLPAGAGLWAPELSSGAWNGNVTSPYFWPYTASTGGNLSLDGTGSSGSPAGFNSSVASAISGRYYAARVGATWKICKDGVCESTPAGSWTAPTYTSIKFFAQTSTSGASRWKRVQVDPDPTRCSQ